MKGHKLLKKSVDDILKHIKNYFDDKTSQDILIKIVEGNF